jgi:sugar phosphate isomerase/epimerase
MEKDFEGTVAKVEAIGYKEVEFAGYFDHSPKNVRAILDEHHLTAPSAHISYDDLSKQWSQVVETSQVIGHRYIVIPWIDKEVWNQPDGWKHIAETLNRAGEISKKAHIQLTYHNHHFEFMPVNGRIPYDILLEECSSELVKMEMDLCWATVGGRDPIAYFHRYPGRFPLVHVKDLKRMPQRTAEDVGAIPFDRILPEITEVGSGLINWKRIFSKSDEAGIQHFFVEHDEPKSAFDSIKTSYDYLSRLRY